MKVLMCVHNFPPGFTGGIERAVEVLGADLAGRGHEVHVFAGTSDAGAEPAVSHETLGAVAVHRYQRRAGYSNTVDNHDPAAAALFDELLAEVAPDVVHVHHWHLLTNDLVAIAARRGIPAVCTLHDFWTTCSLFFRMPDDTTFCTEHERREACLPCVFRHHPMDEEEMARSFDMRFATLAQELELAQAVLVSSAAHLRAVAAYGRFPRETFARFRVLALGASSVSGPLERLAEPPPEDDEPAEIIIGHWGNLSRVKGLELLVRAAARSRHARRIRLRLLGQLIDDALAVLIRDLAGSVRLEVRGPYEPERLRELVADVDFAVFPSLAMETHSLVLDEALLLGLPVIVSDRGAMPDRIGGRGIAVPADDVEALAAAIDRLADPAERRRLAAAPAGDIVDHLTYSAQVEEVYDEVRRSPEIPSVIRDHGRDRLAWRNARLADVARYVELVQGRAEAIAKAVAGDRRALERVRKENAGLAARIEVMLEEQR